MVDMLGFATIRIVALAFLLAVSHAALAMHDTAHSDTELGQCELCFSHAQSPSAAIQSDHCIELDAGNGELPGQALVLNVFRFALQPYHSRAPPFIV